MNYCRTDRQTLYEICKTELYRDCLVGDFDDFVSDVSSNPRKIDLLNRVKSLRLYQADYLLLKEPTYEELLSVGEWRFLGVKSHIKDCWASLMLAFNDNRFADRYLSGPACTALQSGADSLTLSQSIFKSLDRVIMSGETKSFPWGTNQFQFTMFDDPLNAAPIPSFLASLPSVKHYCQCSPTGPLALPNHIIKIDNPPDIVTFHPPYMLEQCGPQWLPPIILGATNRYIFNRNGMTGTTTDTGEGLDYDSLAPFMSPLVAMLLDRMVLDVSSDTHHYGTFGSVSLDKTTIEVYDYIRHFNLSDTRKDPPSDLRHIQRKFEETIGRWKGKVFLKNREDCPPCSACGFAGHPK